VARQQIIASAWPANFGFDARLVRDAVWKFDRVGPDGDLHAAADIHAMTPANLNGGFARIVSATQNDP
jgi:hypothetical protein